jgi:hypothetical protein
MMISMTQQQQEQALAILSELSTRAYLIGLTDTGVQKKGLVGIALDIKEIVRLRQLADQAQALQNELMMSDAGLAFYQLGEVLNEPKTMFI